LTRHAPVLLLVLPGGSGGVAAALRKFAAREVSALVREMGPG
jgi:hypothetical protein